ncbi:MAG: dethiobiotin synthase [Sandaracinaceae bacterium]|nr:dethiobiotin synthase [Sandaracinaceae bacterium]
MAGARARASTGAARRRRRGAQADRDGLRSGAARRRRHRGRLRAPELAGAPGFYRARAALAPYAATLEGEPAVDLAAIVQRIEALSAAVTIVEGAGGVLVPLDDARDVLDLARAIDASVVLVGKDELGVLSHALTAALAVRARGLTLAGVVLTERAAPDPSARTNAAILRPRLGCPVLRMPHARDDDDALADAAEEIARALAPAP